MLHLTSEPIKSLQNYGNFHSSKNIPKLLQLAHKKVLTIFLDASTEIPFKGLCWMLHGVHRSMLQNMCFVLFGKVNTRRN